MPFSTINGIRLYWEQHGESGPPLVLVHVAAALPQAQRYTFQGAGHVPHLTHPEAFVEVVGEFVARSGDASRQG